MLKKDFDEKLIELKKGNEDLTKQLTDLQNQKNSEKRKNIILTSISIVLGIFSVILGIVAFL